MDNDLNMEEMMKYSEIVRLVLKMILAIEKQPSTLENSYVTMYHDEKLIL